MNSDKKTVLFGAIYGIVTFVMVLLWFVLPSEITTKTALSFVFIWLPVTALFGTVLYCGKRKADEVMQNGLLITACVVYLVVAVAVTAILGALPVGIRAYIIIQVILLALWAAAMAVGFLAKQHIEE